ncbi:cytochrome b/b6 domain-containing protein [Aureimonas fodinaquatilis]|uniref:Cytochrome b/b6 domain-containing protein n=1 Tax=Aureimonas fodinaquatilis TaxID=2565783 RepID=A0A5B0DXW6_9HYPH|nr:cytochrome b/b6 domain-containing protein [Aureimonas fodinaquatilis]KAA0970852.1 cytochrome b/b6 domain-containing protein [Aureimonas fodinaquatilis]
MAAERRSVYRHAFTTRMAHWLWAACLFFLLLSGLQIFTAHPTLYIGNQSGFSFNNSVFSIGAFYQGSEMKGILSFGGMQFDTTGWLGAVEEQGRLVAKTFPGWLTIPSYRDLATGRVVHFFFAWLLVATLLLWFVASVFNRHISRDLVPRGDDFRSLGQDVVDHARLNFHKRSSYGPLQKMTYFGVLFVAMPLMVATGLTMSPGMNAALPFLADLFGGRQTARTLHFVIMLFLVGFFAIHIIMVLLSGPISSLRAMITGWSSVEQEKP